MRLTTRSALRRRLAPCLAVATLAAAPVHAQITTYSGFDLGASGRGPNGTAALNSFLAATGATNPITFESAALPSGVTRTGGTRNNSPNCSLPLCGGNTTPGGSYFVDVYPATTFTFATPITYFGAFFGGLQVATNTLTFIDGGGAHTVAIPSGDIPQGGFAFTGFTSAQGGISAVTINAPGDFISVDDVYYGSAQANTAPEPATWALLGTGLLAVGGLARRRRVG